MQYVPMPPREVDLDAGLEGWADEGRGVTAGEDSGGAPTPGSTAVPGLFDARCRSTCTSCIHHSPYPRLVRSDVIPVREQISLKSPFK